jgi:hypothetical protein
LAREIGVRGKGVRPIYAEKGLTPFTQTPFGLANGRHVK